VSNPFDVLPAQGRAAILSLLSRILLKEVDGPLLAQLGRDDVAGVLDALDPGASAEIAEAARDEAAREALDVEYCRLFVLPGGVSPYALAWIGGEVGAARAGLQTRIGGLLDDLGLRPGDHGLGNLPLDHVGFLLALAAVAEELDPGGPQAAAVAELLLPWGRRFAAALETASRAALYRASASLLAVVLA
jgi:TorA maturation chaperone TorD